MRRGWIRGLVAASVALAAALSAFGPAPVAAAGDLHKRLINYNSGKCLAIQNRDPYGAVIQWSCLPPSQGPDHIWTLGYRGGINYWIDNEQTGRCLTAVGMYANQRECDVNDSAQLWTLEGLPYNLYRFHNVATGKCLAILDGSKADGGRAIVWPCGSFADHKWTMGAP